MSLTDAGLTADTRAIPATLVSELGDLDEVDRVDGNVEGSGLFVIDPDGNLIGGQGAPTIAYNWHDGPSVTGEPTVTIAEGRVPEGADEVVLDERTAADNGFAVGDTVEMITSGAQPELEAELVGTVAFGGGGLAGATLVGFDTDTAQTLFMDGAGTFDSISVAVAAADGVSQRELADAVSAVVSDGLAVATGDEVAAETQEAIGTALDFLSTFLLVFAAISLVVGTFLIINTFSILVAQRTRELALLRAMGASRRQVTRAVLVEALAVGIVGSTLGLLLGFGLAVGLRALFAQFGLDLSGTALVFEPRTALVAYVVGVGVTLLAAYLPARRASRIAPVAAMRDDVALPESSLRRRMAVGIGLTVLGSGAMVAGLVGEGTVGASLVGVGVLGVLIGVARMTPVLGRPVLRVLGVVYKRLFGTVGVLATQNALRNPRRTAATASALMIGLALVSTMSVLGGSINRSIEVGVTEEFTTDYLLSSAVFIPFSTTVAERVRDVDGVGEVVQMQFVDAAADGQDLFFTAGDPELVSETYELTPVSGRLDAADDEIILMESIAENLGVTAGDTVTVPFRPASRSSRCPGSTRRRTW